MIITLIMLIGNPATAGNEPAFIFNPGDSNAFPKGKYDKAFYESLKREYRQNWEKPWKADSRITSDRVTMTMSPLPAGKLIELMSDFTGQLDLHYCWNELDYQVGLNAQNMPANELMARLLILDSRIRLVEKEGRLVVTTPSTRYPDCPAPPDTESIREGLIDNGPNISVTIRKGSSLQDVLTQLNIYAYTLFYDFWFNRDVVIEDEPYGNIIILLTNNYYDSSSIVYTGSVPLELPLDAGFYFGSVLDEKNAAKHFDRNAAVIEKNPRQLYSVSYNHIDAHAVQSSGVSDICERLAIVIELQKPYNKVNEAEDCLPYPMLYFVDSQVDADELFEGIFNLQYLLQRIDTHQFVLHNMDK